MNSENTINKFKEFERFGSRLGLERMNKLMELLGNPQDELKHIHVAGTNGKGSVCKYLYEALQENGYKTGIFTSPFLEIFNERIEFDGQMISDSDLELCTNQVLEKVEIMLADGFESPTEFEVITAVAFVYFKIKEADFVILEVGLGGGGDSTNIIKNPLACVITSISFDHTDRLGNTLEEIAGEKAGIIKDRAPVIINVENTEAAKVIARKAYEHNCVLHDVRKLKYAVTEKTIEGYAFDTNIYGTAYGEVKIGMVGKHQIQNAMTALTVMEILRKSGQIKIERSRLYRGMKKAKQKGRFEIIPLENEGKTYCIIDGAHNEAGAAALEETVRELLPVKKILMTVGILADKDIEKIIGSFTKITGKFIITEPESERKMKAADLAENISARGCKCEIFSDPSKACIRALSQKDKYDALIFAGSLYLIGRIRGILMKQQQQT